MVFFVGLFSDPSSLRAAQATGGDSPATRPVAQPTRISTPTSARSGFDDDGLGMAAPTETSSSGDELILFQDLPIVVSASRQPQPINQASESMSVITADDIHYSARTDLPEILQFTPGVDVTKLDRNEYAVGVLGLAGTTADRTLTLIDGRDAGTPAFGDADFLALPLFTEDIERIEVVRGPGGAAWGANALNGVINVITKPLDETQGYLASATTDQYGDVDSQFRWGSSYGPWLWRVSAGYEDHQSSQQALGDDVNFRTSPGAAFFLAKNITDVSGDSMQDVRVDTQGEYRFSDQTKLTFGVADSTERRGMTEFFGVLPPGYNYIDVVRDFARLDFNPSSTSSGDIQLYNNYESSDELSFAEGQTDETDLEGQYNFSSSKDNKLTVGANIRQLYSTFPMQHPTDLIGGTFSDFTGGAFAIDRWQVSRQFALEAQARGDDYTETGPDWSGRMTALYSLDDDQRQVFRVSVARAFREPLDGLLGLQGERLPLPPPYPPGIDIFHLVQNDHLKNEHVYAIEAGYDGQFADGLTFRVDPFYQQYQGLIGGRLVPTPPKSFGVFTQFQNISGGDAYGVNTELDYSQKNVTYSLWYSLDQFFPEEHPQDMRSFLPPEHSAGVNVRWAVGDGWTLSGNYKFTDIMQSSGNIGQAIYTEPRSNQVDLHVSKSLFNDQAEISVGVADLFNQTAHGVAETDQSTAHNTPGRTVTARIQWKW
jgi:outer membrane receptor for ferrienterochelin and colicin